MSASAPNQPAIIPLPQKVEMLEGAFLLQATTGIFVQEDRRGSAITSANYLAERLRKSTGYVLPVSIAPEAGPPRGYIVFTSRGAGEMSSAESYELSASADS